MLEGECSNACMDEAKDRRFTARKVYEMLCYDGYIYTDYDDVSDHAEELRQQTERCTCPGCGNENVSYPEEDTRSYVEILEAHKANAARHRIR